MSKKPRGLLLTGLARCPRCGAEGPFKLTEQRSVQPAAAVFRPPGWPVTAKDVVNRLCLCECGVRIWCTETTPEEADAG